MGVIQEIRRYLTAPRVRPWALVAPVLVLLVCLPLLRPLRYPDPRSVSDDELARLATIQALVEHRTLAIDQAQYIPHRHAIEIEGRRYSAQPAMLSVLLSGPYWVMHKLGLSFASHASLVEYLLTVIGVTVPVALGAGLIYRMGRLFELARWKRAGLAVVVAFASGLVSHGVVLNAQAPAAALVLMSAACLVHVTLCRERMRAIIWILVAGMFAWLAASIEPAAIVIAALMTAVIPTMRWNLQVRLAGVAMYLLSAAPFVAVHAMATVPITGDIRPPALHPQFAQTQFELTALGRAWGATVGHRGVLSHVPVLLLGIAGIAAVMHRNWPVVTKTMASMTAVSAALIVAWFCAGLECGGGRLLAAGWFIVFAPLMLFWTGAWLRRVHRPATWVVAGVLVAFSISITLVGATQPVAPGAVDASMAQAAGADALLGR